MFTDLLDQHAPFKKKVIKREHVPFMEGCPILSTRLHRTSSAFHRKTGSPSVKSTLITGVPSDTNGFHRTCGVSVRKILRIISSIRKKGCKVVPKDSIGSIGHE